MATLTETAYLSRKIINLSVIFLVIGIFLKMLIENGILYWQRLFPAPPPPPNYAFGKLTYPNAQNNIATPSGLTYSLETIDGNLPVLPLTFKVYFMPQPTSFFGSFDATKTKARGLGFADIPKRIGNTAWRFTDKNNNLRTLDIDELSGNYRVTYNYGSDLALFDQKNFNSDGEIISSAQSVFSAAGEFPEDLKTGKPAISYLRLQDGGLVTATSLSNTDAAAVTFNRADIDKIPVVSPDKKQGLVSVLLSGNPDPAKKVLEARYFYTQINLENFGTYPPIKSIEAFELLKAGKAIYAGLPNPVPNPIIIREIYPAYLDPYPPQTFLQPVLVFSDQKDFQAYVPLVSRDWLENAP